MHHSHNSTRFEHCTKRHDQNNSNQQTPLFQPRHIMSVIIAILLRAGAVTQERVVSVKILERIRRTIRGRVFEPAARTGRPTRRTTRARRRNTPRRWRRRGRWPRIRVRRTPTMTRTWSTEQLWFRSRTEATPDRELARSLNR